ncbi:hypothetical protein OIU85_005016 [Salix viminalis]|uniref:Uncharacterized protein n=1 Tax=Salix viminalis TaxID=40686 RepID=A0A9Q0PUI3_SALVM|nr:hypothetical protein OIU85_005016 [Salix viminalis]
MASDLNILPEPLGLVIEEFSGGGGGKLKIDVISGVLVLSLLGAVLIKGFKRGIKDWVLGFCFFGVLLILGLKKGEMQKWVERCRVRSPVLVLLKGKRRHGRRIW